MSFSYDLENNPSVAYVRLLIADTVEDTAIFSDEEIVAAGRIAGGTFQSAQFYGAGSRLNLPSQPVSYLRVAALLLDALACNKGRLTNVTRVLDVTLSADKIAGNIRSQADNYRKIDDESGAFAIIEQCFTSWGFLDRFNRTIQRQNAGI